MVVDRLAASRLIGELLGPANGYSLQQNTSFWQGKLGGKRAVSKRLTITDEPLLSRGLGSRPFDGEGISSRTLPIIEAGKLRNVYLDSYYAKKLGMVPTTGYGSNRVVTLGKRDLSTIVADVGSAIYVTSWLGGNSDSTTGEFSFGMRGHLIEGGKIGAPGGRDERHRQPPRAVLAAGRGRQRSMAVQLHAGANAGVRERAVQRQLIGHCVHFGALRYKSEARPRASFFFTSPWTLREVHRLLP